VVRWLRLWVWVGGRAGGFGWVGGGAGRGLMQLRLGTEARGRVCRPPRAPAQLLLAVVCRVHPEDGLGVVEGLDEGTEACTARGAVGASLRRDLRG
jgi:hypothetical protein